MNKEEVLRDIKDGLSPYLPEYVEIDLDLFAPPSLEDSGSYHTLMSFTDNYQAKHTVPIPVNLTRFDDPHYKKTLCRHALQSLHEQAKRTAITRRQRPS